MYTVLVTTVTTCAVISFFLLATSYDLLAGLTFGRSTLQYLVTVCDKTDGLCTPAKPVFRLYGTSVIATLSKFTVIRGFSVWDLRQKKLHWNRKIMADCSKNHTKYTNALWVECRIYECYCTWCLYLPSGFRRLIICFTRYNSNIFVRWTPFGSIAILKAKIF